MIAARKGFPLRALRNKAVMAVREMEDSGADQKEVNAFADKLYHEGRDDPENKFMAAGQIAGSIKEVINIEKLIRQMVEGAKGLSSELAANFAS